MEHRNTAYICTCAYYLPYMTCTHVALYNTGLPNSVSDVRYVQYVVVPNTPTYPLTDHPTHPAIVRLTYPILSAHPNKHSNNSNNALTKPES